MNIALLVPATSHKRSYTCFKETDLYCYLFKSFFTTYSQEHNYTIYLGIDESDKFYQNKEIQNAIKKFISAMKNTEILIYDFDDSYKGNVAGIWSQLYKEAYDSNDYFIQIGSDIIFMDNDWINVAIDKLKNNDDIGVVGLVDQGRKELYPNDRLLTQSIVSKKHRDIFNFYFPPEILNWACDNWITDIYENQDLVYRIPHRFYNFGGSERYNIDKDFKTNYNICMKKYQNNIRDYKKLKSTLKWMETKKN